jgi:hypothetical protein
MNPQVEQLHANWQPFKEILIARSTQSNPKMRLKVSEVNHFVVFLNQLHAPLPHITKLQKILPKTTLELLMAVHARNLSIAEAEKMAAYLAVIVEKFQFKFPKAFDENTSHIIGREWHEIDYSGEKMTWQKQQLKYKPYGITDFKSLANLQKFFVVESTLPYFNKTYEPARYGD